MHTIYRFNKWQDCFFDTEEQAKDFLVSKLKNNDLLIEEYKPKVGNIRIDLVVRYNDFVIPIEIKSKLYKMAHLAGAFAQAHSYSEIIKRPVFIGPIMDQNFCTVEREKIIQFAKVIGARMNVGFVEYDHKSSKIIFWLGLTGSSAGPILEISKDGTIKTNTKRFIYRTAYGSKFEANRIIT